MPLLFFSGLQQVVELLVIWAAQLFWFDAPWGLAETAFGMFVPRSRYTSMARFAHESLTLSR